MGAKPAALDHPYPKHRAHWALLQTRGGRPA